MKRAYRPSLITIDNKVIGIDFGYTTQLIKFDQIQKKFGIELKDGHFGYESRKMKKIPSGLHIGKYGNDSSYIIFYPGIGFELKNVNPKFREVQFLYEVDILLKQFKIPHSGHIFKDYDHMSTSYDSERFIFHGKNSFCGDIIDRLENAFLKHDVVIMGQVGKLIKYFGLMIYS